MKNLYLLLSILFISLNVSAQLDTNDFVTTWKTDNAGSSNDLSITIYTDPGFTFNYGVDWNNDGIFDTLGLTSNITHTYSSPGTYTIRIKGQFPSIKFGGFSKDEKKIVSINQWGAYSFQTCIKPLAFAVT